MNTSPGRGFSEIRCEACETFLKSIQKPECSAGREHKAKKILKKKSVFKSVCGQMMKTFPSQHACSFSTHYFVGVWWWWWWWWKPLPVLQREPLVQAEYLLISWTKKQQRCWCRGCQCMPDMFDVETEPEKKVLSAQSIPPVCSELSVLQFLSCWSSETFSHSRIWLWLVSYFPAREKHEEYIFKKEKHLF